ncbi:hypothetical protein Tco_1167314 [Tanacetum coccineum]
MILESVEHSSLIWPMIEENRVTRIKKYADLSATENIQADCYLKATNIILQGLPYDIYSLVNHTEVLPRIYGKEFKYNARGDKIHLLLVYLDKHLDNAQSQKEKDATWFRDKVLLVEAQGNGKVLNEEEWYSCRPWSSEEVQLPDARLVLMANLSSYRSDVLSKVPHSEYTHNDMINQSVQEMLYSEQNHLVNYPENEITSDSNIIPYSQYLLKTQNAAIQDTNSSA